MAKRRRAHSAYSTAGKRITLNFSPLKAQMRHGIALLQKAAYVHPKKGKPGKAASVAKLKKALTAMEAFCPSMGIDVQF